MEIASICLSNLQLVECKKIKCFFSSIHLAALWTVPPGAAALLPPLHSRIPAPQNLRPSLIHQNTKV